MIDRQERNGLGNDTLIFPCSMCAFGYGVHPWRVFLAFVTIIVIFTFLYVPIEGVTCESLSHSVYASALTMFIPSSVLQNPKPGLFFIVAILQAILGLLWWAMFIATLTRKYGR